jgi:hypothetical protein
MRAEERVYGLEEQLGGAYQMHPLENKRVLDDLE